MSYYFNDRFIGFEPNTSKKFHSSDNEYRFLKNLKKEPRDWIWRTKEIEYDHNRYGHRCKNIEKIDLDNYILFAGCSHTEGIGLPLENTYSYLVADKLKKDYYNLSLAGSANDVIEYNLITWLKTVKKKPDCIVVQPASAHRYTSINRYPSINNTEEPHEWLKNNSQVPCIVQARGAWDEDRTSREFVARSRTFNIDHDRADLSLKLIEKVAKDIPVLYFCFMENKDTDFIPRNTNHKVLFITFEDKARDALGTTEKGHAGIKSNEIWSEKIAKAITNNF